MPVIIIEVVYVQRDSFPLRLCIIKVGDPPLLHTVLHVLLTIGCIRHAFLISGLRDRCRHGDEPDPSAVAEFLYTIQHRQSIFLNILPLELDRLVRLLLRIIRTSDRYKAVFPIYLNIRGKSGDIIVFIRFTLLVFPQLSYMKNLIPVEIPLKENTSVILMKELIGSVLCL